MQTVLRCPGVSALTLCASAALVASAAWFGPAPQAALAEPEGPPVVGNRHAAMILTIGGKKVEGDRRLEARPEGAINVTAFTLDMGRGVKMAQDLIGLWDRGDSSKRAIGTATILKEIDAASPDIARAVVEAGAERGAKAAAPHPIEIELRFYKQKVGKNDVLYLAQYYSVRLHDVRIDALQQRLAPVPSYSGYPVPVVVEQPPMEELTISFSGYEASYGDPETAGTTQTK